MFAKKDSLPTQSKPEGKVTSILDKTLRRTFDMVRRDREILEAAIEPWKAALLGIQNRAAGMLYRMPGAMSDYGCVAGSDTSTGLCERIKGQATVFSGGEIDSASMDFTDQEVRNLFLALRLYQGKIEKIKKGLIASGYHTLEQDADLDRINGWLGEFDRGWQSAFDETGGAQLPL